MSRKVRFIWASVFVFSLFSPLFAGALTRIRFAKGTYGKVVVGYLNNYSAEKKYVLWARKGQTLKVRQIRNSSSGKIVSLRIKSPSGEDISDLEASCNSRINIVLPETGDFQVKVFECQKADEWRGKFKLNFTIK